MAKIKNTFRLGIKIAKKSEKNIISYLNNKLHIKQQHK